MKLKSTITKNNDCQVSHYISESGNESEIPLLIINGGPGQDYKHLLFSPVWEQIAKNRKIYFYDQRGTGRSLFLSDKYDYSLQSHLLDIITVLDSNEIPQINILAHSWGGFIGLAFAARYPERVAKLILVDASGPSLNQQRNAHNDFFPDKMNDFTKYLESGDENLIYKKAIEHNIYLNFLNKEYVKPFLSFMGKTPLNVEVNSETFNANKGIDLTDELINIKAKVLILHGRYDITVKPSIAYELNNKIENSSLLFFESSGHLPFIEEPDSFITEIDSFLKS